MPDRCELTDLPDLDAEVRAERARLLGLPGWFAAQYPGHCSRCGKRFEVGAAIRAVNGFPAMDGYRAECCGESTGPAGRLA